MPKNPLKLLTGTKYTAVDFGHHSIKVVHCKVRGESIKVLATGSQKLPRGTIVNGKIEDIPAVNETLEKLFDNAGISPGFILFSPAAGEEFVRKVEVPIMPEDELEEALRWEVQEFLNLPPERVASDYLILHRKEEDLEILLAVMPHPILDDYTEVFEKSNLHARVANMQELSLISLLAHQDNIDNSSIIINIGANKTRILIASEDDFYLSRSIEVAGSSFTRLFKDEETSWEDAEEKKKRTSLEPDQEEAETESDFDMMMAGVESDNNIQNSMLNLANELIREVGRSLDYYRDRNPQHELQKIFLTGGAIRHTGLREYLEDNLDLEVVRIHPFESFKNSDKVNPAENPIMAVAAGLIASEVIHNES